MGYRKMGVLGKQNNTPIDSTVQYLHTIHMMMLCFYPPQLRAIQHSSREMDTSFEFYVVTEAFVRSRAISCDIVIFVRAQEIPYSTMPYAIRTLLRAWLNNCVS